jgi:hypothetical protein
LMPVLPKNRSIRAAIHNVSPIKKVASTDAAASKALPSHPGLSFESVIMMLISAGPTRSGNAKGTIYGTAFASIASVPLEKMVRSLTVSVREAPSMRWVQQTTRASPSTSVAFARRT